MFEFGAALTLILACAGWAIEAHRRSDERLDAAEGKISNLLIEVQRNRAHLLALAKRLDREKSEARK